MPAERYAAAERLLPVNASPLIVGGQVAPSFIGTSDRFWFLHQTQAGHEFRVVDPAGAEVAAAFDHDHLAACLAKATGEPCEPQQLPFGAVHFADDDALYFAAHGRQWRYDGDGCDDVGDAEQWSRWSLSPDGRWAVTRDGNDLVLIDVAAGRRHRVSDDSTPQRRYGTHLDWWTFRVERRGGPAFAPLVVWSPDSSRYVVELIDETDVEQGYLVDTAGDRPRLHSFAYALPGDEHLPLSTLFVGAVDGGPLIPVDLEPVPVTLEAQLAMGGVRWSPDSKRVEAVVRDRFFRRARLIDIDPTDGTTQTVVDEQDATLVEPAESWQERPNARVLADGGAVWFSRRDGWGHLWLVDGERWTQLTSGPWVVRELLHVDEAQGVVYFTASGREPGRHPYHRCLYRVGLDGGTPQLLTADEADHEVTAAPSGRWFVDCFSTNVDPPSSCVRGTDGRIVADLGAADVTGLRAAGWTEPIPFSVTSADGATELCGVLYPPPDIDGVSVPIVDCIYPGPMKGPSQFRFGLSLYHCEAIAALGFAAMTLDARGTPYRSRAFVSASYHQLEFTNLLADHAAAIAQLAERYPWIDGSRAGIIGASGGGYAAARAVLTHPDVFQVGVSAAGNHDNRLLVAGWAEPYLGPVDEDPGAWERQSNATVAGNLQGKLMVAVGCMDNNVPPYGSLAFLRALIDANRDVDVVLLPDEDHWFFLENPYFTRRSWDYLVEHLRDEAPPQYEISRQSLLTVW